MNNFKDKFQRYILLRAVVYIAFGIFAVIEPEMLFQSIVYVVSIYLAILGILGIFSGFRAKKETDTYGGSFISGIFLIIAAAIILFFAPAIASIFPFFLGILIVINAVYQLINAVNAKNAGASGFGWIIFSLILAVLGIILIFNPFSSLLVLFQIFGGILILMAISEVIAYFKFKKMMK